MARFIASILPQDAPESYRIYLHPDDMLSASLTTGEWVAASLIERQESSSIFGSSKGSQPSSRSQSSSRAATAAPPPSSSPTRDLDLWAQCTENHGLAAMSPASKQLPGQYLHVVMVWPSPKVARGAARLSTQLKQGLGQSESAAPLASLQLTALPGSPTQLPGASSVTLQYLPLTHDTAEQAAARRRKAPPPPQQQASALLKGIDPARRLLAEASDQPSTASSWGSLPPSSLPERFLTEPGYEGARSILASFASRHLSGRALLPGNIISIPYFGQSSFFLVKAVQNSNTNASAAGAVAPLVISSASTTIAFAAPGDEDGGADEPGSSKQEDAELKALLEAATEAAREGHTQESGVEAATSAAASAIRAGYMGRGLGMSSLGGLAPLLRAVHDLVVLPLTDPDAFARYGVRPPRGVLLHGPPGTGKTYLARALASQAKATLLVVNGPDLVSEYYGESEAGLKGVFAAARRLAPCILFLDEADSIAPSRERGGKGGDMGARLVASLANLMDGQGLSSTDRVVVIAATNRPDALDESLRRPGRFDREIEVGVPSPSQREEILQARLSTVRHCILPEQIAALAAGSHGFVAADLASLIDEACIHALRAWIGAGAGGGGGGGGAAESCELRWEDMDAARTLVRPSALREIAVEVPRVRWSDIGGLEEVKRRLKEVVELPLSDPDTLARLGVTPPKGVLLYGPPGCSKTLLARAVATEARMNFLAVKGPELFSKYVGESEKAVAALFARARRAAPAIVFFDEIDGLVTSRTDEGAQGGSDAVAGRMLGQLLTEMDGLSTAASAAAAPRQAGGGAVAPATRLAPVIVLAATNRPDALDTALLRPGRFDRLIFIPPPGTEERAAIFGVHLRKTPVAPEVDLQGLASRTEGFTGAEVAAVCREAALAALGESLEAERVQQRHFDEALKHVRPALLLASQRELDLYKSFQRH